MTSYAYSKTNRLLTIDNVSLSLGNEKLFDGLSLHVDNIIRSDVNQGQVIGILGPSGVGKSQLLRMIAGLQRPLMGNITIHVDDTGTGHNEITHAGLAGMVFQDYPLLPHRTVLGNLQIVCNDDLKVDKYLQFVGLHAKRDTYPVRLSGGERQRIAIIQQFLANERFLLLDEPLSGLDPHTRHDILELIVGISYRHEHNTIIMTTHDVAAAVEICDTIWVLGSVVGNPGKANLIKSYDLAQMGLAWRPKHEVLTQLRELQTEIEALY
jgi:ABC-type nitrate/sulfonate/bicarbonate transport system ATPase subunit